MLALGNLLVILYIAYWISKRWADSDKYVYWGGLAVRLLGGVAIKLVYDYYYHIPGDTTRFFVDATALNQLFYSDPKAYFNFLFTGESPIGITSEPRSAFFISLVSIVTLLTNNYYVTTMWFSLFSFLCCYRLVKKLYFVFPDFKNASRIALLFTPTVVFWTSGIVKECIAFGAVAMLCSYFLSYMRGAFFIRRDLIGIAFFLFVLITLKYYWAAVLVPSMISGVVVHKFVENRFGNRWTIGGSWLLCFLLMVMIASFTHPNFYPERFLSVIVENHDQFVKISDPGNIIHYNDLSADFSSMLINSPWALFSGLFRPTVFNTSGIGYVVAVENLLLLVLVIWKLKSIHIPRQENLTIVLSTVVFVMVLCIFLALSTPNLGTLSRYRVGFLPFFVLLILADHPILKLSNGKPSDNIRSEPPRAVGSRDF